MTAQNETPAAIDLDRRGRDDPTTTGGLMQQAVEQASGLIAAEVQLAKQEVRETVRSGVVALIAGAAAVFGVIAFLVMAVVTVVSAVSLHWAAALGFAVFFLGVAAIAGLTAVTRLRRMRPLRQTSETVKQDVAWAKQQLSRDAR